MKLLLLTLSMDRGGAETHVMSLAVSLARRGHEVTVASSGGMLVKTLQQNGVKHCTLPWNTHEPLSLLRSRKRLKKLIKRGAYDLIHAHGRLPTFFGAAIARKQKIPLVTTVHARFSDQLIPHLLTRFGTYNIAVGEDLKQQICEEYSVDGDCVWVIPNGIDTDRFCPNPKARSGQAMRIVFVSRLDADCSLGADLLLELCEELKETFPSMELLLAGGGEELVRLQKKAKIVNDRLGSETVGIMGYLPDPVPLLQSADVILGVSRVALEAMACGTPVILGGNEGFLGISDPYIWHEAESTNFCCRESQPMTADCLRDALMTLLRCSPEERDQLGRLGRAYVKVRHSLSHMTEQTEALYQKSIKSHKAVTAADPSKLLLLCGYYGYGNLGDETLLKESIKRVRRDFPSLTPVALTKNGKRDALRYGIPCIGRKNPFGLLRRLRQAKLLVLGGGTLLQDATSLRSLLYYSAVLQVAKGKNARIELWGNGLGKPHSHLAEHILKRDLILCDRIELRDKTSEQIATKLLQKREQIRRTDDLAAHIAPAESSRIHYLLRHFHLSDPPAEYAGRISQNAAKTPKNATPNFSKKSVKPFVIAAPKGRCPDPNMVRQLKKNKQSGRDILFVPLCPSEDLAACRRLQKNLGGQVAQGLSASDLVGLSSHAKGVYAMRLHALIFAKQGGVPFFGFGNDPKIQSFCKENKPFKSTRKNHKALEKKPTILGSVKSKI